MGGRGGTLLPELSDGSGILPPAASSLGSSAKDALYLWMAGMGTFELP